MPFVAGGDEGGVVHHLYKGPDAMRRGTLPRHVRPLMIERPISAVEAIARRAALPRLCSDHRITAGFAGSPIRRSLSESYVKTAEPKTSARGPACPGSCPASRAYGTASPTQGGQTRRGCRGRASRRPPANRITRWNSACSGCPR